MDEIKTKRLVIRQGDQSAANAISELNDSGRTEKYLNALTTEQVDTIFRDKDAVAALLKRLSANVGNSDTSLYGAWLAEKMIGYIALVNCSSSIPELQIEIDPVFQGCGYGYEFLKALLLALFEEGRYESVRYTVLPSNEASIALVRKIGAFLQKPESEAEEILIKTYLISKLSMDAGDAYYYSSNHKPELQNDHLCGCFDCMEIFSPTKIEEWVVAGTPIDWRGTAICPYCGDDSVIGESSGYPITKDFLSVMHKMWFEKN